ncbi:hypothetical protein AVEN_112223-1 [Araneus ventricosus]|uniref:Uncharacterized protein n=1 Tax=Araneus ventricosus TaxID=182803 RepID=A0A4Y2UFQ2_ARAVE|nr:hypothetical protein AVEN_112223-1 [Araneus ventricosus]
MLAECEGNMPPPCHTLQHYPAVEGNLSHPCRTQLRCSCLLEDLISFLLWFSWDYDHPSLLNSPVVYVPVLNQKDFRKNGCMCLYSTVLFA